MGRREKPTRTESKRREKSNKLGNFRKQTTVATDSAHVRELKRRLTF